MKQLTVDDELHQRIRIAAAYEDKTIGDMVKQILDTELTKMEAKY